MGFQRSTGFTPIDTVKESKWSLFVELFGLLRELQRSQDLAKSILKYQRKTLQDFSSNRHQMKKICTTEREHEKLLKLRSSCRLYKLPGRRPKPKTILSWILARINVKLLRAKIDPVRPKTECLGVGNLY